MYGWELSCRHMFFSSVLISFSPSLAMLSGYNTMLHRCHQVLIPKLSSQNFTSPAPAPLHPYSHQRLLHPHLSTLPLIKITISKKGRQTDWQTDSYIDRCFPFSPEINTVPHTDSHTGGLFGKIPGHLFQSGTAGLWTPTIQLMSLCETINLSTKPYFVGQKAFSVKAKDKKKKQRLHISSMSKRKRPRVRVKRENCYHYLGKAKKVQSTKTKSRNNQDGYFFSPPDTSAPLHYQNWSCL